jgi:5-methylcytosine-specific restriction endonuclease McrA
MKSITELIIGGDGRRWTKVGITREDFISWHNEQKKECYYCGRPQTNKRLSIDRKDNSINYNIRNIVLACDDCNSIKGDVLTEKEMLVVGKMVMQRRWKCPK